MSRKWLQGFIGAAINSGITTITNMIVDPGTFNIADSDGLWNVGKTALVAAVIGGLLYLKEHKPWDDDPMGRIGRPLAALLIALGLSWTVGCAAVPVKPIANPALQVEGQIAGRGTQLVAVIRTAQLALEPLVDARVVTAGEAVKVAESLGAVLQTCDALVSALRVADATRDAVERVQALREAGQRAREALQTLTGISGHISSDAGKLAVGAATTKVINAVADLVPALGGAQ